MRLPSTRKSDSPFSSIFRDIPGRCLELAKETGAFHHGRGLKTVEQLLQVVLLYCGLDYSLAETAALCTLRWAALSHQAIDARLRCCGPWLQGCIGQMLRIEEEAWAEGQGRRVLLVDATNIAGRGGRRTAFRLHLCIELRTQSFVQLEVTDEKRGESLANFAFQPGDIVVADRGYCRLRAIVQALQGQVDVVVRLHWQNLPLYELDGRPLELAQRLQEQPFESTQTVPVLLGAAAGQGSSGPRRGWLHCYRLCERQAAEARRKRLSEDKHKKGKTPKDTTLFLCGFFLVFTSLPPQTLPCATVLQLYRARWQIELGIKRLKSLLNLERFYRHKPGSKLGQVWLLGKLFYALLLERAAQRIFGRHWLLLDSQRPATRWRPYKLLKASLDSALLNVPAWAQEAWSKAFEALCERPRKKRHLQRLPSEVFELRRQVLSPPLNKAA